MAKSVWRHTVAVLVLAILALGPAQARDLDVDADTLIEVEVATVAVATGTGAPVVLLRDPEAGDIVPIVIGVAEAHAILRALAEQPMRRPMTHDLMADIVGALDATLERVFVDDLADGTFFGILELRVGEREERLRIDTRPSDGLALALRAGASIHVAPHVLEAGRGLEFEALPDDRVATAIGITVMEATADLREALQVPDDVQGLLVSGVRGPAEDAGLAAGAMITSVNEETPDSPMNFLKLIRDTPEGENARIGYWLAGERHEIEVRTDVAPATPQRRPDEPELTL